MPLNDAFEILQRDRGKHFDPQVVDAFVRFYEKDGKLLDASINANIRTKDPGDGHDHKRSSAGDQILEMPRKKRVEAIELNTRGT
jgi:hypothetical protein